MHSRTVYSERETRRWASSWINLARLALQASLDPKFLLRIRLEHQNNHRDPPAAVLFYFIQCLRRAWMCLLRQVVGLLPQRRRQFLSHSGRRRSGSACWNSSPALHRLVMCESTMAGRFSFQQPVTEGTGGRTTRTTEQPPRPTSRCAIEHCTAVNHIPDSSTHVQAKAYKQQLVAKYYDELLAVFAYCSYPVPDSIPTLPPLPGDFHRPTPIGLRHRLSGATIGVDTLPATPWGIKPTADKTSSQPWVASELN